MIRTCVVLLAVGGLVAAQEKKTSADRWEKAIAAIEKRDKAAPPPAGAVFFCGSSSVVRWDLKKHFGESKKASLFTSRKSFTPKVKRL